MLRFFPRLAPWAGSRTFDPPAPRQLRVTDPLESLFTQQLPTIRRLAAAVGRRNGLRGDEVDEWLSWLCLRFVEQEYAMLAKFRGESALSSYLAVVVALQFRDYRAQQWGRWRPSAEALRRGDLAVRLETLVRRDGIALAVAGEMLRTRGETSESNASLGRLLAALPDRAPLRPVSVGPGPLESAVGDPGPDAGVVAAESASDALTTEGALGEELRGLPPEDQVILRMRFQEGSSVADVARALGVEQRPLYRRIERLLADLRRRLEERGVSRERVRALLDDPGP